MAQDEIVLRVPAHATYARSVRMLATNLAVVADLTIDDVEDVRMAAEEGFIYAIATGQDRVEVAYTVEPAKLTMHFSLGKQDPESVLSSEALAYTRIILDGVVDDTNFSDGLTLIKEYHTEHDR